MKITETLVGEHAVFAAVFDQIESALPRLSTVAEVRLLAGLVEGMLSDHADTEKELAYMALDHVLENKGQLDRLHEDHHEIDAQLKQVQTAVDFTEARRLLKKGLRASRDHFRREERIIFPMIDNLLQAETLATLGCVRMQRYLAPVS